MRAIGGLLVFVVLFGLLAFCGGRPPVPGVPALLEPIGRLVAGGSSSRRSVAPAGVAGAPDLFLWWEAACPEVEPFQVRLGVDGGRRVPINPRLVERRSAAECSYNWPAPAGAWSRLELEICNEAGCSRVAALER